MARRQPGQHAPFTGPLPSSPPAWYRTTAGRAQTLPGAANRNRRPTLETIMQHRAESLLEALFHTLLTLVLVLSLPALYRLDDMAADALAQAGMILAHYLIRRGFLRHEVCAPGACDRAVEAETVIELQRQILQLRSAELANLEAHRMSLENDLHRTRAELSEARRALRTADQIDEHELLT